MKQNTQTLHVVYSTLSSEALQEKIESEYDFHGAVTCSLVQRGLNDTYLVDSHDCQYIFRLYRHQWRTIDEIEYELEVINHLASKGVDVSIPMHQKNGQFIGQVEAPEGTRPYTMFTFAPGKPLRVPYEEAEIRQFGQAIAQMHAALADFSSQNRREPCFIQPLLDRPLKYLQPILNKEQYQLLSHIVNKLKAALLTLPAQRLTRGICHLDLHGSNAHFDRNGTVTFIDFDFCAPGWVAYDLAVFRWNIATSYRSPHMWPIFLNAYMAENPLKSVDLQAIPIFVAARHIWLMGIQAANVATLGRLWLGSFGESFQFLENWTSLHIQ